MKFSGVQCLIATTICVFALVSVAVANEESTKDAQINSTELLSVEDTGRKIFKKKIICPLVKPIPSIPDLSGLSGLFTGIQDFLSEIGTIFTNIGFPPLPDFTSIFNNTDQIIALKKLQLPAIFFLSLVVGAIAAAITIWIPSLKLKSWKNWKPENMFGSMLDGIADMMDQANYNVPAQYGAPELDSYPPAQQGYPQSQGYQSPDAYSLTYSGTDNRGMNNDFAAPASTSQDSSFFPSGQGQGQVQGQVQGQGQGQVAQGPVPATGFNSASSTYTEPSAQYGSPVKRYNAQPYPSLSSNYLRTAKSRK